MPKPSLNASYKTCRRWSEVEARAALAALADSGLAVGAFAAREGLDVQRLYAWRRRLCDSSVVSSTHGGFIELRSVGGERVEVVLRSGVVLRVADSVDAVALARIVEALESIQVRAC